MSPSATVCHLKLEHFWNIFLERSLRGLDVGLPHLGHRAKGFPLELASLANGLNEFSYRIRSECLLIQTL
jgi:hypothetical protein